MDKTLIPIYTNSKANYCLREYLTPCFICRQQMQKTGFLTFEYIKSSKKGIIKFFCNSCFKDERSIAIQTQKLTFIIVDNVPKDAKPFILKPMDLISGISNSVFDLESIEKEFSKDHQTTDKTVYAGRSDNMTMIEPKKAKKYIEQCKKEIKELDSPVEDIDKFDFGKPIK